MAKFSDRNIHMNFLIISKSSADCSVFKRIFSRIFQLWKNHVKNSADFFTDFCDPQKVQLNFMLITNFWKGVVLILRMQT